ncbi:hypothetical protein EJ02DRAFT_449935 [Clathrospora elynae]|uniref:XPA C-terminal domain-containing protein n=1 Tax=Clathrospora elynae TaxID=706981 RepID=A0A6A5T432_9PLEO|nr:hypothetical protein EJ02DRAFT_449935 [Clathrospora elynae]
MSGRRSGRTKAPVKYTSASEGSDFEDQKKKRTTGKKAAATKKSEAAAAPKKSSKRAAAADPETDQAETDANDAPTKPKAKRQKKEPETLAAEARDKTEAQDAKAAKAASKKAWEAWLKENDAVGKLLEEEPQKGESVTQTDALKKYGLKPAELASLLHFEKPNPLYKGVMKLFLEEEVKKLCYRKLGMLDGEKGEGVLERGEEIWNEKHKDDHPAPEEEEDKPVKKNQSAPTTTKASKSQTPKQKWTEYITTHTLSAPANNMAEEPVKFINQTECKTKYSLTPQDLAVLPYFTKTAAYGKTTKLFEESEVKTLVYRKTAVIEGVEDDDDVALVERGREIFEAEEDDEEGEE